MQPSYDADDFMRRGFFGSIIGFRKRTTSKSEVPSPAAKVVVQQAREPIVVQHQQVAQTSSFLVPRTEYDIYREIVSEAQLIERSPAVSPLSDFSPPTTPQEQQQPIFYPHQPLPDFIPTPQDNMLHHDPQKIYPPYHMVMTSMAPHPIPVDQKGVPCGTQCPMAPPPYSSFVQDSSSGIRPPEVPQPLPNIPYEVKREIQEHLVAHNTGSQQVSIEEIVKLVVSALKDSQIEELKEEESPEEILRRKRVQNNLAAARYRKRQREAREVAESEFGELSKRNEQLRDTVARMEHEIAHLKAIVLNRQV